MRDPVLERNMFRKEDAAPPSDGVVSLVNGESDYDRRKRLAAEMIAVAKERQNPENYKTLSEQSRPGVFRPVATGQPQAPQPNTQQQMAQMQAMGFRPVGMADGGYVQRFANGSGPEGVRPFDWFTGTPFERFFADESEDVPQERVTLPGPRGPSSFMRPVTQPSDSAPTSPLPSGRADDAERGIRTLQEEPKASEEKPRDKETGDGDKGEKPDLTLDEIRARRAENINMALIQAGLAMAAGQSPNALTNIAAGGISGLGAFAQAEKERRADLAEERKYREDKQARIQRSAELRQEKDLTREARVYDTAQSNLAAIDREISRLQMEIGKAMGDETQIAPIRTRIQELLDDRRKVGGVVNRSLRNLGYEGEDIFSAAPTPVAPAIDISKLPK